MPPVPAAVALADTQDGRQQVTEAGGDEGPQLPAGTSQPAKAPPDGQVLLREQPTASLRADCRGSVSPMAVSKFPQNPVAQNTWFHCS